MMKLLLSVDIATKFIPVCMEYEIQCNQKIDQSRRRKSKLNHATLLEYT